MRLYASLKLNSSVWLRFDASATPRSHISLLCITSEAVISSKKHKSCKHAPRILMVNRKTYNLSLRWIVFVMLGNWKGVTYDVLFAARANRQLTTHLWQLYGCFLLGRCWSGNIKSSVVQRLLTFDIKSLKNSRTYAKVNHRRLHHTKDIVSYVFDSISHLQLTGDRQCWLIYWIMADMIDLFV